MGVSHIAIAVKDIAATHRFYSESMGFELVKTEIVPKNGGFARHAFYSTGSDTDQMIAFWDLSSVPGSGHDTGELRTDICRDLGLDPLTNHLAFTAADLDDIAARQQRWLDHGHVVVKIDHGWVTSIYTEDPDGISVEFAVFTRPPSDADKAEAFDLLFAAEPAMSPDKPVISFHEPADATPAVS